MDDMQERSGIIKAAIGVDGAMVKSGSGYSALNLIEYSIKTGIDAHLFLGPAGIMAMVKALREAWDRPSDQDLVDRCQKLEDFATKAQNAAADWERRFHQRTDQVEEAVRSRQNLEQEIQRVRAANDRMREQVESLQAELDAEEDGQDEDEATHAAVQALLGRAASLYDGDEANGERDVARWRRWREDVRKIENPEAQDEPEPAEGVTLRFEGCRVESSEVDEPTIEETRARCDWFNARSEGARELAQAVVRASMGPGGPYLPGLGTLNACRQCHAVVAGGPTICGRCAGDVGPGFSDAVNVNISHVEVPGRDPDRVVKGMIDHLESTTPPHVRANGGWAKWCARLECRIASLETALQKVEYLAKRHEVALNAEGASSELAAFVARVDTHVGDLERARAAVDSLIQDAASRSKDIDGIDARLTEIEERSELHAAAIEEHRVSLYGAAHGDTGLIHHVPRALAMAEGVKAFQGEMKGRIEALEEDDQARKWQAKHVQAIEERLAGVERALTPDPDQMPRVARVDPVEVEAERLYDAYADQRSAEPPGTWLRAEWPQLDEAVKARFRAVAHAALQRQP